MTADPKIVSVTGKNKACSCFLTIRSHWRCLQLTAQYSIFCVFYFVLFDFFFSSEREWNTCDSCYLLCKWPLPWQQCTQHRFICYSTQSACLNWTCLLLCLHITQILFSLTLTAEQTAINTAYFSRQHPISYHPFSNWDARQKKKTWSRLLIQKKNTYKLQVFKDTFFSQWQGYSLDL